MLCPSLAHRPYWQASALVTRLGLLAAALDCSSSSGSLPEEWWSLQLLQSWQPSPILPTPMSFPTPQEEGQQQRRSSGEEATTMVSMADPVPLVPSAPPVMAKRVLGCVRSREGEIRTGRVLQPLRPISVDAPAYVMDSVISSQPHKQVTIWLAHPAIPDDDARVVPYCMVPCGPPVAIKITPKAGKPLKKSGSDDPLAEVAAMQCLGAPSSHPYVIHLLDCMQDDEQVYLVLPYLSGGDLFSRLEVYRGKGMPESETATYFRQMCEGLLSLKQKLRMAHHDVSLENAMVSDKGRDHVRIIDMGMCLQVPRGAACLTSQRRRGKANYIAPEVVREEPCDPFASDIWSLGVCLYCLLTGRPFYNSPRDLAFRMLARGEIHEVLTIYEGYGMKLAPYAKDLVRRMMQADPSQRLTLEEVLSHPFLRSSTIRRSSTASSASSFSSLWGQPCGPLSAPSTPSFSPSFSTASFSSSLPRSSSSRKRAVQ